MYESPRRKEASSMCQRFVQKLDFQPTRESQPKTTEGNSNRLLAKMMGITPPWLTRKGRYCRVPP
jgi:hypothetical protein